MPEPIELAISNLTEHFLNHSETLLASQITSLAIQLSPAKDKNEILSKMGLASELIISAKKHITREMIQ